MTIRSRIAPTRGAVLSEIEMDAAAVLDPTAFQTEVENQTWLLEDPISLRSMDVVRAGDGATACSRSVVDWKWQ